MIKVEYYIENLHLGYTFYPGKTKIFIYKRKKWHDYDV